MGLPGLGNSSRCRPNSSRKAQLQLPHVSLWRQTRHQHTDWKEGQFSLFLSGVLCVQGWGPQYNRRRWRWGSNLQSARAARGERRLQPEDKVIPQALLSPLWLSPHPAPHPRAAACPHPRTPPAVSGLGRACPRAAGSQLPEHLRQPTEPAHTYSACSASLVTVPILLPGRGSTCFLHLLPTCSPRGWAGGRGAHTLALANRCQRGDSVSKTAGSTGLFPTGPLSRALL